MASASRLEVLMVLIEAGGLLVSEHELLSHVWPGQGKLQGELNFGIEALKPLWHQGLPPFNRILGFLQGMLHPDHESQRRFDHG
jgi:hypothetical protein